MNLLYSPNHGAIEIRIYIIDILHKTNLIPIPTEKSKKLLMIHAAKDGPLTDLESIQMQNWQNCTRFLGIKVFDCMPGPVNC